MEFEEIYQLYFRDVFRYIRSLTPDEVTAEEIDAGNVCKSIEISESI